MIVFVTALAPPLRSGVAVATPTVSPDTSTSDGGALQPRFDGYP